MLEKSRRFGEAFTVYQRAIEQVTDATPKDQKRKVFEGVIFNSLYEPPPEGYRRAIEYAERYIREEPRNPSHTIFAYLAAAYGQQARDLLKQAPVDSAAVQAARDSALNAVRQAVETNAAVKPLLHMMWDPKDPAKSPEDNDLEVFFDDKAFVELLGP